jgi:hypothetical protein
MVRYLARLSFILPLRIALVLVLSFSLSTVWSGGLSAEQERETYGLERYELKFIAPVRANTQHSVPASVVRLSHHGNALTVTAEPPLPVLCVSFFPIIYIILKRLLLYPLKYTSHFVAAQRLCGARLSGSMIT